MYDMNIVMLNNRLNIKLPLAKNTKLTYTTI